MNKIFCNVALRIIKQSLTNKIKVMKKISTTTILTLLAFVFIGLSTSAQGVWTQKANYAGGARAGCFAFSIDSFGYMGGGNLQTDFWRYNPTTNAWTQKADMTDGLTNAVAFVINGIAYVALGNGISTNYQQHTYAYNPTTNVWTLKATFPAHGQYSASCFAIGNYGYTGLGNPSGGASGPFDNGWYRYNPTTDVWDTVASFPGAARWATSGFTDGTNGYVGLGVDNSLTEPNYNDWWQYNPTTNTWTQKSNIPGTRRFYCAGFVINGKIYVGAGQIHDFSNLPSDTMFKYSPGTDTWSSIANYAGGLRFAAKGFAIGAYGYMGTGNDDTNDHNDFWQYTPQDVGIDEASASPEITIYPNPASTVLTIHQATNTPHQLVITDVLGKEVYCEMSNGLETNISVSSWKAGIYFYELRGQEGSKRGKFIVN